MIDSSVSRHDASILLLARSELAIAHTSHATCIHHLIPAGTVRYQVPVCAYVRYNTRISSTVRVLEYYSNYHDIMNDWTNIG